MALCKFEVKNENIVGSKIHAGYIDDFSDWISLCVQFSTIR